MTFYIIIHRWLYLRVDFLSLDSIFGAKPHQCVVGPKRWRVAPSCSQYLPIVITDENHMIQSVIVHVGAAVDLWGNFIRLCKVECSNLKLLHRLNSLCKLSPPWRYNNDSDWTHCVFFSTHWLKSCVLNSQNMTKYYVDAEAVEGLRNYKYAAVDNSLLYKYFASPLVRHTTNIDLTTPSFLIHCCQLHTCI